MKPARALWRLIVVLRRTWTGSRAQSRHLAFVLALSLPPVAHAFQDKTVYLQGVTVTATASASGACGFDFVIRVTDGDQHFVSIDYTYHGVYDFRSPRQSKTWAVYVSVGKSTQAGYLTRIAAESYGLDCRYPPWDYIFSARQRNMSAEQREYENGLKQKEQARIDEINRRRADEAERKRKSEQGLRDRLAAEAKSKRDQLAEYRRLSPENARCIINDFEDIQRCEQAKARDRLERLRLQEAELQAERQREAARTAALKLAEQQREQEIRADLVRTNPCAAAEDQARRMPEILQRYAAPTLQNEQAKAQWKEAQARLEATCAASKTQTTNVSAPVPGAPSVPQLTPEQQKAQALLELLKLLTK